ncbi:hypothetical protein [Pandoraea apista]|uniref:Uncharacterized protein n=1 Tax=Pandoraea apista TaxID=93218 RepID=A0A5E5P307_9BURK|nr:hypothetical protein [Pandoraea apista]OXS89533.1 hypothetical protein B7H01_19775 [Pandoraea apista]VVG70720.1 hypothetical protein PAP18089_01684 [Pandoraea apista]
MSASSNLDQEMAELRMKLKTNPMFSIELLGAISQVCRQHDVVLSSDLIGRLVLARYDELTKGLSVPVLPGGTNC